VLPKTICYHLESFPETPKDLFAVWALGLLQLAGVCHSIYAISCVEVFTYDLKTTRRSRTGPVSTWKGKFWPEWIGTIVLARLPRKHAGRPCNYHNQTERRLPPRRIHNRGAKCTQPGPRNRQHRVSARVRIKWLGGSHRERSQKQCCFAHRSPACRL